MSLKDEIPLILKAFKDSEKRLKHNEKLFKIYEGDLKTYVMESLKSYLSEKSVEQAKSHIAPINVLKRLVDKLSKIYAKTPIRKLDGGSDSDQKTYDEIIKVIDLNTSMSLGNEFFNLFKYTAVEPFLDRGKPQVRVIPSDRFIVLSIDKVNPMRPTHFSKIMGTEKRDDGTTGLIFYTYNDAEFLIHDEKGNVLADKMAAMGLDGINPIERLPITYINRSRHDLIPTEDTDTFIMTVLIAVLLSDLNYALKFQCFSIIYGINVSEEGLKIAPNAFWNLKTDDPNAEGKKPEIGSIKPSVDSDKLLAAVKTQLAFWMQCRNIKPGAIGDMTLENAASGFAKMIDEMDTSEDRQKQVPYFMAAEDDLFDLIKRLHNGPWMADPEYKITQIQLSEGVLLQTQFAEQRPMVDSSKVIADEVLKLTNKLTTRELALKTIYPDMDEAAIQDLIKKIDAETQANIAKNQALLEQQGQQDPDQAQEGQEPGAPQPPKAGKKAPPFAKKAAPVGAKA
jgi:hypothetical protein